MRKVQRRVAHPLLVWWRSILIVGFGIRNRITNWAPISARIGDVSFSLVPDGVCAFEIWAALRFERAELELILDLISPGETFLDVGANVGLFSVAVGAKSKGMSCSIHAFEPCPQTFAILEKNIALNDLNCAHTHTVAISDQKGQAVLCVNAPFKDGLNSLARPSHSDAEVVGETSVQTISLDAFLEEQKVQRVDIMKIDVEGAELHVCRGAQKLLSRPDAPLILYEGYSWCTAAFHYHPVETMWLLSDLGYEIFVLDPVTGEVRPRRHGEPFDFMVVAVKPTHPCYPRITSRLMKP